MKKLWRPGYDNPKRNGYLKQMRRRWMVLPCLLAIVALPAACLFSVQEAASASPPVAKDGQPGESTFSQIVTLLNDYYPKCKIAKTADKLHFEYRAHMFANAYTSREELAPEDSGIVGDIILKAGPRSPGDKSPKIENQYYYCALTLAPYSQQSDKHLNVVLRYAPDTSPEFIKHFTTIVDEFGGESQSEQLANAAPPAVPNKEAAPATATLIETNAIKPPAQSKTAAQVTSPPPVAAKSVSTDKGRPLFLWKAVRGKEVVYLSGTVHLAGADLYPLPGEIDDAFDQSKQLMVEVAIDRRKLDPAKIQQLIKTSGTYLAPDKLSKHLSPETHKALDAYLAWAGESWAMYEQYKPWYVAQAIEESLPRRGDVMKIKGGLGIDRYLLARAKSQGKPVAELETVEFQTGMTTKLSEKAQDALLLETIFDFQNALVQLKEILQAWKDGDATKLGEVCNRSVKEYPSLAEYHSILLDQRNLPMANKIDQLSKTSPGPLFVAVGSAHLIGDQGLVNALSKRGFQVEQVFCKPSPKGEAQKGESDKFAYMQHMFKVWMPEKPTQSQSLIAPQVTTYRFDEPSAKGSYLVFCLDMPQDQSSLNIPGPLILDSLLTIILHDTGATVQERHSELVDHCCCRKLLFSMRDPASLNAHDSNAKKKPADPGTPPAILNEVASGYHLANPTVRANAYLFGRHIYFVMACGSKQWVNSPNVNRFMDSIEFMH